MTKNGSGAYYSHYNPEKKSASLDFSGCFPFYPGDTACYRNDSTVFLYVAHSYLSAYYEIKRAIREGFDENQEKRVQHLIIPVYYLYRHYVEMELKSFFMALKKERADNTHELLRLHASVQVLTENCDGIEGNCKADEFGKIKKEAIDHLNVLKNLIEQYQQMEPFHEFYRYLYDSRINLPVTEVNFDYAKHDELFTRITKELQALEACFSEMIGFNYLMG